MADFEKIFVLPSLQNRTPWSAWPKICFYCDNKLPQSGYICTKARHVHPKNLLLGKIGTMYLLQVKIKFR